MSWRPGGILSHPRVLAKANTLDRDRGTVLPRMKWRAKISIKTSYGLQQR